MHFMPPALYVPAAQPAQAELPALDDWPAWQAWQAVPGSLSASAVPAAQLMQAMACERHIFWTSIRPLSSCRRPQAALNRSYRGDRVARD